MAQDFAALAEGGLHQVAVERDVDGRGFGQRHHAHHRAVDPGWWVKTLGRHKQHVVHGVAPLQHHAQAAVVAAARRGDHAVDHFLLQHEVLVLHHRHMVEQVKQNRRGDVVGQVAHDAQLLPQTLRDGAEVHLEHIAFDHVKLRMATQARRQIAVEFHHGQPPQTLDQGLGQRGQTGADFDHGVARAGCDLSHDGVDDAAVGEEVLSEALARDVLGHGWVRGAGLRASPQKRRCAPLAATLRTLGLP